MAITVVDDMTTINSCDTLTGDFNTGTGVNAPNTADTDINAEGTASWRCRVTGANLGGVGADNGSGVSLAGGQHVFIWARTLDLVSATDGWRIRISSGANTNANYTEISVGDANTSRNLVRGFYNFVGDPLYPPLNVNGTRPTWTNNQSFAILANHTTSSSRDTMFVDEIKVGTGITVTGGAATPRGSAEIASNDETNGRGTFQDINGVYYVMGRITLGDTAAATNSTFEDSNQTWVWQSGAMGGEFNQVMFMGGTGTNRVTFGSKVGTGTAAVGLGGNTFLAAGEVPFSFHAHSANIDTQIYGCTFLGLTQHYHYPPRRTWVEDNSATSFTDETFDAISTATGDVTMLPATQALNDAIYFASGTRFGGVELSVTTAATGTWDLVWEYYNGSTWEALDQVNDGTNSFTTTGTNDVIWHTPDGWVKNQISDTTDLYYVRARINSFTSSGTAPVCSTARVHGGCHIHWEHSACDIISNNFNGMEQVHVHNGAIFRRNTIISSTASGLDPALDLGDTPFATDAVRDISVQNCAAGVAIKGAGTWTFRNFKFANNTVDVINSSPATITDSYAETNQNATTSLNNTTHGIGQSVSGDGGTLSRAKFYLSKTGTPTGNAVAKLYAISGTSGTSGIPTGTALATSEVVDVSTLTGTLTLTDFEFRDEVVLTSATDYVLTLEYTGGTAGNTVNVGTDTTSPTHAGNFSTANTSFTWTASSTTDACFYMHTGGICTINVQEGGDTPTVETWHGATIVNNTVSVKVTAVDESGSPIQNARLRLTAAAGGPLTTGTVILEGLTDSSGSIENTGFNFQSNQPVTGVIRKSTSAPFYKSTPVTGTITSAGLDLTALMQFD